MQINEIGTKKLPVDLSGLLSTEKIRKRQMTFNPDSWQLPSAKGTKFKDKTFQNQV